MNDGPELTWMHKRMTTKWSDVKVVLFRLRLHSRTSPSSRGWQFQFYTWRRLVWAMTKLPVFFRQASDTNVFMMPPCKVGIWDRGVLEGYCPAEFNSSLFKCDHENCFHAFCPTRCSTEVIPEFLVCPERTKRGNSWVSTLFRCDHGGHFHVLCLSRCLSTKVIPEFSGCLEVTKEINPEFPVCSDVTTEVVLKFPVRLDAQISCLPWCSHRGQSMCPHRCHRDGTKFLHNCS